MNEEQKREVAKWFAAGASLDEIQKRIQAEFGVHMTYLDLRLMVAELPQPTEPEPPAPASGPEPEVPAMDASGADSDVPAPSEPPKRYDLDAPDADAGQPSPDVVVELDALTIPGTFASGDVTFSDGTKGKWFLDQQGRLGLEGFAQGFRPSPSDAALFQTRLMELLRSHGMM